jgi:hypothetical protein
MMVDKPDADLRMPGGLLEAAKGTWLASARNVRVSALHREVSRLLADRGVPHAIEHLTDDNLFSVDIALPGAYIRHLILVHVYNLFVYLGAMSF